MKKAISLFIIFISLSTLFYIFYNRSNFFSETNKDLLKEQIKTQRFIFYSKDKDKVCIEDLSKELEKSYETITNNLGVNIDGRIDVRISPDIKSLHEAMGLTNADDSVVGSGWGKEIKIVSPLNPGTVHNYNSVKQVLIHEFVHIVISNINSDIDEIPSWINEGIATYEAKQMNDNTRNFIKQRISENKIPNLNELDKGFSTPDGSHIFSYTIVEFLVSKYGYDKLIHILKSPKEIDKILGISKSEFEREWISFLKDNYS
ncbi:peptidase MA family metallohydrolase [Terrisporobacter glycolicus]|uniref:peptidase MA family metallohydrolase n=1 Tax=Terrisporobacter glycolicus TaxID=36841 RepID=UPI0034643A25